MKIKNAELENYHTKILLIQNLKLKTRPAAESEKGEQVMVLGALLEQALEERAMAPVAVEVSPAARVEASVASSVEQERFRNYLEVT